MKNSIEIRNFGGKRPWRICVTGTDERVEGTESYETLDEAAAVGNRILAAKEPPRPASEAAALKKTYVRENFGDLAGIRVEADLSQNQAAERLGIAPNSLSNIERGAVSASFELLGEMAALYKAARLNVIHAHHRDYGRYQTRMRKRRPTGVLPRPRLRTGA